MAHIHVLTIKSIFGSVAGMRRQVTAIYPTDERNVPAHELLLALAQQDALALPSDLVSSLDSYGGPRFAETVKQVARDIGFHFWPADLAEVIREIITRMEEPDDDSFAVMPAAAIGGAR